MPNWCSNTLTIYNPKVFKEKCCNEKGCFQFQNFIPEPDHMRLKNNLMVDSWLENQVGADRLTKEHIASAEQLQNEFFQKDVFDYIQAKPWMDAEEQRTGISKDGWHDWNCEHWGTKWDLSDDEAVFTEDEFKEAENAGMLDLVFDTAWSPPIPVFEQMAKLGVEFSFSSEEPGCEIYMSGESNGETLCYSYDEPPEQEEE